MFATCLISTASYGFGYYAASYFFTSFVGYEPSYQVHDIIFVTPVPLSSNNIFLTPCYAQTGTYVIDPSEWCATGLNNELVQNFTGYCYPEPDYPNYYVLSFSPGFGLPWTDPMIADTNCFANNIIRNGTNVTVDDEVGLQRVHNNQLDTAAISLYLIDLILVSLVAATAIIVACQGDVMSMYYILVVNLFLAFTRIPDDADFYDTEGRRKFERSNMIFQLLLFLASVSSCGYGVFFLIFNFQAISEQWFILVKTILTGLLIIYKLFSLIRYNCC